MSINENTINKGSYSCNREETAENTWTHKEKRGLGEFKPPQNVLDARKATKIHVKNDKSFNIVKSNRKLWRATIAYALRGLEKC